MKKLLLSSLLMGMTPVLGQAATLPVINGAGVTVQMNMQTDSGGAFSPRNIVCDASNPDTCAPVNATTGLTVTPVQSTATALNVTAAQPTATLFNATVFQPTGTNLHMICDSGCSASNLGLADEGAFTAGSTTTVVSGGFYQTTATSNPLSTGQGGAVQLTQYRAVMNNMRNASGVEIGTAATPVQVSLANTGVNGTALVDTATINQGGSALSTTNGLYTNLLQSNAVIAAGNPIFVTQVPVTANGLSIQSAIVANNTTSVAVGASAARKLFGIDGYSISASTPAYIKLFNTAQGSVTCGTPTPVGRYMIPASGGAAGSGQIMHDANGVSFSTALTYCITGAMADNDTTAPAASTYIVNFYYE